MEAINIKPISFGVLGNAVKANTHGNWIYDKQNESVMLQIIVFDENDNIIHLYPFVTLPATSSSWENDEQIILAAFLANNIEIQNNIEEINN